jgi:hypothetical protein
MKYQCHHDFIRTLPESNSKLPWPYLIPVNAPSMTRPCSTKTLVSDSWFDAAILIENNNVHVGPALSTESVG